MALTSEEINEVKKQLYAQVAHLHPDQRAKAEKQINELTPEAIEELVNEQRTQGRAGSKTIFRMLVDKEVDSVRIGEDDSAIAVLEINPASEGHTLIIPKEAITDQKEMPQKVLLFGQKMVIKLMEGLSAKSVEMQSEVKFGEKILNLIPVYNGPLTLNSPRKKAEKTELESVAKKLEPKPKKEVIKIETKKSSENPVVKLKRRVP